MPTKQSKAALLFMLERGIFLESSGTLLPWDTPWQVLKTIGRPTVRYKSGPGCPYVSKQGELTWRNRSFLGGLRGDVIADVSSSFNRQKTFTDAVIGISGHGMSLPAYRFLRKHLTRTLGKPTSVDRSDWNPVYTWRVGKTRVVLRIIDFHVLFVSLTIGRAGRRNR